ncbi:unnamed protein product, partial [Ectocarpus sp. 12 AP-2014]
AASTSTSLLATPSFELPVLWCSWAGKPPRCRRGSFFLLNAMEIAPQARMCRGLAKLALLTLLLYLQPSCNLWPDLFLHTFERTSRWRARQGCCLLIGIVA